MFIGVYPTTETDHELDAAVSVRVDAVRVIVVRDLL
jgi:hypothetical protein